VGRETVKIAPDTNVLLRAIIEDDAAQATFAQAELAAAEIVAISLPTLCEFVWVLERSYKIPAADIARAIDRLVSSENVVTIRPAVEAGLAMLKSGGDFADGVIAFEGRWLGGGDFVSFDEKAVMLIRKQGHSARPLASGQ
jgi:predicted nucleic-acid-binding protein